MHDRNHIAARFATTSWTLVRQSDDREALGRLLRAYWSPVYAYLRRTGRGAEEAAELTQAFVADVMLGRNLPRRASPEMGRFRSYLLRALDRYVVDMHRREQARRPGHPIIPLTAQVMEEEGRPDEGAAPAEAFERQWAASVLRQALDRLRDECERDGLGPHWRAFEARVVTPALRQVSPVPLTDLADEFGVEPGRVAAMVQTVKRRLGRVFVDVVAETLATPGLSDAELEDEVARVQGVLRL